MSILGSDLKFNINVIIDDTVHLENCDFTATFFVDRNNKVTFKKEELSRVDKDTYLAMLNSSLLGVGTVKMTLEIEVPDDDFKNGKRVEIDTVCTGVTIQKKDV